MQPSAMRQDVGAVLGREGSKAACTGLALHGQLYLAELHCSTIIFDYH